MNSPLRVAGSDEGRRRIEFTFDGKPVIGLAGDTVAVALLAAGIRTLRQGAEGGGPRGMFCAMGVCQECVVVVDGANVEACRLHVSDGLDVRSGR
jgi:aerobic-type carbon monoxide dehydrogenase small subunit (CoxS/CutS family)